MDRWCKISMKWIWLAIEISNLWAAKYRNYRCSAMAHIMAYFTKFCKVGLFILEFNRHNFPKIEPSIGWNRFLVIAKMTRKWGWIRRLLSVWAIVEGMGHIGFVEGWIICKLVSFNILWTSILSHYFILHRHEVQSTLVSHCHSIILEGHHPKAHFEFLLLKMRNVMLANANLLWKRTSLGFSY